MQSSQPALCYSDSQGRATVHRRDKSTDFPSSPFKPVLPCPIGVRSRIKNHHGYFDLFDTQNTPQIRPLSSHTLAGGHIRERANSESSI